MFHWALQEAAIGSSRHIHNPLILWGKLIEVVDNHRIIEEPLKNSGWKGPQEVSYLALGSKQACTGTAQPLRATCSTALLSLWRKCFSSLVFFTHLCQFSLTVLQHTAVRSAAPAFQSPLVDAGHTASTPEAVSSPADPAQQPSLLLKGQILQSPTALETL